MTGEFKNNKALSSSKRLATNVFFVYFRIVTITIIGLITTRLVFRALGQSDYGLYNVVAGIIAILGVVSTAMTTTARRFINYEMGKQNSQLNKIFSTCFIVNFCLAILLLILAETIGLYYIYHYLNVTENLFSTAVIIFHISTLTAVFSIINVPYQSLIAAHENFNSIAIIDICVTILKLIGVICLFLFESNRLIIYAWLMSVLTILSLLAYTQYCKKKWSEIITIHFIKDKKAYKEIFVFNNYIVLGASAYIGRTQGANMLINYFFGTLVNGAFSIASIIESYAMMVISNLTTAAGPQITKEYSAGNCNKALEITSRINKLSIILMLTIVFIALLELPFFLKFWLGIVPEGSLILCQWTLVSALVRSFAEGIPPLIQASGQIKWFQIAGSSTQLIVILISWILFRSSYPPQSIIICFVGMSTLNFIIRLFLLRIILTTHQISHLIAHSFKPVICITIFYSLYYILTKFIFCGILPIPNITMAIIFSLITIYYIGFNKMERQWIISNIKNKFRKS